MSNPPGAIKYTDMKRITLLFLVLVPMFTVNLCSQGPDEYKTQLMKYLKDERINESLILSVIALQDYPENLQNPLRQELTDSSPYRRQRCGVS